MIVVGLTGSIGMGKSTVGNMFRKHGVLVHDSDAAVHAFYSKAEEVAKIEALIPGVTDGGNVVRERLSDAVFKYPNLLKDLEALVHPWVGVHRDAFLQAAKSKGAAVVVLDIPLLFEVANGVDVDIVLVVTAPISVQRDRVLARPRMSPERFAAIMSKQMPDSMKRLSAHCIVETSGSFEETERLVVQFLRCANFIQR